MSEATVPTGGSNKMKISRTTEDLNRIFGFNVGFMDFKVNNEKNKDKDVNNRGNDEKKGETGSTSGNDGGDTSTPIIPGNYQIIDGRAFAKVLSNSESFISKPVKSAEKEEKEETQEPQEETK